LPCARSPAVRVATRHFDLLVTSAKIVRTSGD
jgi:hypothetical protein